MKFFHTLHEAHPPGFRSFAVKCRRVAKVRTRPRKGRKRSPVTIGRDVGGYAIFARLSFGTVVVVWISSTSTEKVPGSVLWPE